MRYWAEKFDVSPDQLKAAVKKVGDSAEAVEKLRKAILSSLLRVLPHFKQKGLSASVPSMIDSLEVEVLYPA